MKIIDLSIPIEDGLPSDPPIQIPKIQYCSHKDTAEQNEYLLLELQPASKIPTTLL